MAAGIQKKGEGKEVRKLHLALLFLVALALVPGIASASVPGGGGSDELDVHNLDPMKDYLQSFSGLCGINILPTGTNSELKFISPLVHCFENMITNIANGVISTLSMNLTRAVNAAMVLFVIIFGVRVVTGQVNSPKNEVLIAALKLAFVAWLVNSEYMGIMNLWYMTLGVYQSMLSVVIAPATLTSCPISTFISLDFVWNTMDCLFSKILGFNATNGYGTSWQGIALVISSLVAKASEGGSAYLIAAFVANALLTILFGFLQICMAYIISMIGLMLLFALAPLILPLMFFKQTFNYFEAWYKMIISFILQVVILFAFTSFAFGIIDQIYSGPDGLKEMFGGTQISNEVSRTDVLGTNTVYWQNFQLMFSDAMSGKGDMNMIVNFVSLLVLGYLMLSFISIIGQIAHELSGTSAFPNLMSNSGHGMNFGIPKV